MSKKTKVIFIFMLIFLFCFGCARKRKNPYDLKSPNYLPPVVKNFYLIGSDKVVYLFWNEVSVEKINYHIYRKSLNDASFSCITKTNKPQYKDTEVINDQMYYYKIKTEVLNKESDFSEEKIITPKVSVLTELKINWTKYEHNPVFKRSDNPLNFDYAEISGISVIYVEGKYIMYYCAHKDYEDINGDKENDMPFRIGRAVSSDGINWQRESNSVLDIGAKEEWDGYSVMQPNVLYDDENKIYRMWYVGKESRYKEKQWYNFGYAWSEDGINWIKSSHNPILEGKIGSWDETYLMIPCIYYDKETKQYYMWYKGGYTPTTGSEAMTYIGHAISYNPEISWQKFPFSYVMEDYDRWGYLICSTVIKELGIFHLWFSGNDTGIEKNVPYTNNVRIGYAISSDGIKWTPASNNSVLGVGSENSWDDATVTYPSVIKQGNQYQMWYIGCQKIKVDENTYNDTINNSIGYAIGGEVN